MGSLGAAMNGSDSDFIIPVPLGLGGPNMMPIDEAVEIACDKLDLPFLGGPSGRGWSMFSTAQKCPWLFYLTYDAPGMNGAERRWPAAPLQIGGLYHTLQALYYAPGLDDGAFMVDRGIVSAAIVSKRGRRKPINVRPSAADDLLTELKTMGDPLRDLEAKGEPIRKPSLAIILEAERLFDAHTNYYGNGNEDLEPLAIEWLARHDKLGYTCRYDAIVRVGEGDPLVRAYGLKAGSIAVLERKTAGWLSEPVLEGWPLDGEILGQLMSWKVSGCEALFGPLAALVIDVVTKKKVPELRRIIMHPDQVMSVKAHERWTALQNAEIALWRGTGLYAQRFSSCFDRWGKCSEWEQCARGINVQV
jgi:hypothetical protein